jgi:hypothetical protein
MKLHIVSKSDQPTLPAWKAFVVQFSLETNTHEGTFAGRVEHLRSGRQGHFNSPDGLLVILDRMLGQIREPTK